ncbi:VOC family protein [Cellulomonas edaphi]|uniref:VOC family protein n=1 Tax=Cellulomonas edaphi TaxID=3053468 RepID=A0ABT7S679_9CELL|nr:VOC family protein [Cellulomons edaphi]MDM7831116.1 VOC family protein [Cellulomons edaphi]
MLSDHAALPTLAVSDLTRARQFYEDTLKFVRRDGAPDGVLYATGPGAFLVYESSFAGTNKATAISFQVGDAFDAEVADLRAAGIEFQTFDVPDEYGRWSDGILESESMRAVWFADPDGNIINLETGTD